MNSVKESNTKTLANYFFNDTIRIKNIDLNKIKIDEKSYTNIFIYCIRYVTIKN